MARGRTKIKGGALFVLCVFFSLQFLSITANSLYSDGDIYNEKNPQYSWVVTNPHVRDLLDRKYPDRGDQGVESNPEYVQDVLMTAVPGFVIGTLCCCLGCFVCCTKYCCKCPCFTRSKEPETQMCYGTSWNVIFALILFACGVVLFVGVVIGFVGDSMLSKGTREFVDKIVVTLEDIQTRSSSIGNKMQQLDPTYDPSSLDSGIKSVVDGSKQVQDFVYAFDTVRSSLLYLAFNFTVTCGAIGVAAALLRKNSIATAAFVLSVFTVWMMWYTQALNQPFSIFLDDLCYSIDQALENEDADNPLSVFINCVDGGLLGGVLADTVAVFDDIFTNMNDTTTQLINYSFDSPLGSPSLSNEQRLDSLAINGPVVLQNIEDRLDGVGTQEAEELEDEVRRLRLMMEIAADLLALTKCSYLNDFLNSLKESLCDDLSGGIMLLIAASYMIGSVGIPLGIIAVWAVNRFGVLGKFNKSIFVVQAISFVQIAVGVVAVGTSSRGFGYGMLLGVFCIAAAPVGLVGARFRNKLILLAYGIAQLALFVIAIIFLALLGTLARDCTYPECPISDRTSYSLGILVVVIQLIPIFIALLAARKAFSRSSEDDEDDKGVQMDDANKQQHTSYPQGGYAAPAPVAHASYPQSGYAAPPPAENPPRASYPQGGYVPYQLVSDAPPSYISANPSAPPNISSPVVPPDYTSPPSLGAPTSDAPPSYPVIDAPPPSYPAAPSYDAPPPDRRSSSSSSLSSSSKKSD